MHKTDTAEVVLALAVERAGSENLLDSSLSRHKSAVKSLYHALNGSPARIVRPGYWVSLYAREPSTSTLISNMKFVASIMEWGYARGMEEGRYFYQIAKAIRVALAVRE